MREDRLNREKVFSRKSSVRKWHGILTCLAAVVVFGTVYSLILPAITMTKDHPTLAAEEVEGWSGDELKVRVTAETETSGKEKTFVLISESKDADIAPEYYFNEEGICSACQSYEKRIHCLLTLIQHLRWNWQTGQIRPGLQRP